MIDLDPSTPIGAWVAAAVGAPPAAAETLPGSTTASVVLLRFDAAPDLVLRRYDRARYLQSEPEGPQREVDALRLLADHPVPAPRVVAADVAGVRAGCPVVLLTRMPGGSGPHPAPWAAAAAEALGEIHGVEPATFPHRYRRYAWDADPTPPPWSDDPALWERAFAAAASAAVDDTCLIHRDYHHGNTLWDGERLAVVDWASACAGPAAVDLSRFRLNLHLADRGGLEADFLDTYHRITGTAADPRWDVVDVVDVIPWEEGPEAVAAWRGLPGAAAPGARQTLERFLRRALGALGE